MAFAASRRGSQGSKCSSNLELWEPRPFKASSGFAEEFSNLELWRHVYYQPAVGGSQGSSDQLQCEVPVDTSISSQQWVRRGIFQLGAVETRPHPQPGPSGGFALLSSQPVAAECERWLTGGFAGASQGSYCTPPCTSTRSQSISRFAGLDDDFHSQPAWRVVASMVGVSIVGPAVGECPWACWQSVEGPVFHPPPSPARVVKTLAGLQPACQHSSKLLASPPQPSDTSISQSFPSQAQPTGSHGRLHPTPA